MGAELRKPTELEQGYGSDAAAGTGAHTTADTARGPQGTAGGLGGPEAERLERLHTLSLLGEDSRGFAGRKGWGVGRGSLRAPGGRRGKVT